MMMTMVVMTEMMKIQAKVLKERREVLPLEEPRPQKSW